MRQARAETNRIAANDRRSALDAIEGLRPASPLSVLAEVAAELNADEIVAEAQATSTRVAEGRFYLTCIGQFKRGKSTLLNALVGEAILPTGVPPVTSVVTILRYGPTKRAHVRIADEGWRATDAGLLAEYVTESGNPGNHKRVEAVEVCLPSSLLEGGMCLVDTPGVGSVFEAASEATRRFVPHIDAALIVLGADPPISGEELALVKEVARNVPSLIFVMNKADRLSVEDRRAAVAFTRSTLDVHLQHPAEPIYEISATEVMGGRHEDWDWGDLVARLTTLAREGGAELVRGAEARGVAYLAGRLTHEITERRAAITRPLTASQARVEAIGRSVESARQSLLDLTHLLDAEHRRLATALRHRQQKFVEQAVPEAIVEFGDLLARLDEPVRTRLRARAVSLDRELSHRRLDQWRAEQLPFALAEYRRTAKRFTALGNAYLTTLRSADLAGLPSELPRETVFRGESRLHYTDLLPFAPSSPWTWMLDRIRSRRATLRALELAGARYLEQLLSTNTSRIVGDLIEQALESRRQLEVDLRNHIQSVATTATRALEQARAMQEAGSAAVEAELARLDALQARVTGAAER